MALILSEEDLERFIGQVDFRKGGGLVPIITQDALSDKVLMQAFMDEEAQRLTLRTGEMHYWSRSRRRIWLNGEESGNRQIVQNAVLDCGDDTILFKVRQLGLCCHTGRETCFHKPTLALVILNEHCETSLTLKAIRQVC